jgi:hypothetical protein
MRHARRLGCSSNDTHAGNRFGESRTSNCATTRTAKFLAPISCISSRRCSFAVSREGDAALDRFEPNRLVAVDGLRPGVEYFEDAMGRAGRPVHDVRHLANQFDGLDEHDHVQQEGDKATKVPDVSV